MARGAIVWLAVPTVTNDRDLSHLYIDAQAATSATNSAKPMRPRQGVEMVPIGYHTQVGLGDPYELDALTPFHNHLSMQAGAYQNAT